MGGLSSIVHMQWLLFGRRRRLLLMAAALALLGSIAGRDARSLPLSAWGSMTNTSLFAAFLLVALAGDGLHLSRAEHVEDVLLSTPVAVGSLVVGAYVAEVAGLALLSSIYPLIAMLADHAGASALPPLGPRLYVAGWIWLVAAPLVLGVALAQIGMVVFGGRRALVVACLVLLWALPALAPGRLELLDISTITLAADHHLAHPAPAAHAGATPAAHPARRGGSDAGARDGLPHLPPVFYVNRALLPVLAAIVLAITTGLIRSYRLGL